MAENEETGTVQEAVGIFFDVEHLRSAIRDLVDSGFHQSEIGLLAGERTIERSLGDFYTRAAHVDDTSDAPSVAFVASKEKDDTLHASLGGLVFYGTTTLAGAAVASAAVLGSAVLAAVSGVAAVGAVGAAVGLIIHKSDSDYLKEQLDEGHLLLFVRAPDGERAESAVEILARHCAYDPRVYSVEAQR